MKSFLTLVLASLVVFHDGLFQFFVQPRLGAIESYSLLLLGRETFDIFCIAALFYLQPRQIFWGEFPPRGPSPSLAFFVIVSLFLLLFAAATAGFGDSWFFEDRVQEILPHTQNKEGLGLIYIRISAILLAPLREELFFRAWLLEDRRFRKPAYALLGSTILFALAHFPTFAPREILVLSLGGMFLGLCYWAFGFWSAMVCHIIWNALMMSGPDLMQALLGLEQSQHILFLVVSLALLTVYFRGLIAGGQILKERFSTRA